MQTTADQTAGSEPDDPVRADPDPDPDEADRRPGAHAAEADTVVTASGERVPEPKDPLAESTTPHRKTADQLDDSPRSRPEDR